MRQTYVVFLLVFLQKLIVFLYHWVFLLTFISKCVHSFFYTLFNS